MRFEQLVELQDGRKVILRELRVGDVHKAIGQSGSVLAGVSVASLADPARLKSLLEVLGDCVDMAECPVESLSFSEIQFLIQEFREVNSAFFGMLAMAGVDLGMATTPGGSSGGPAAPSSSAGIPASLNTAGASS